MSQEKSCQRKVRVVGNLVPDILKGGRQVMIFGVSRPPKSDEKQEPNADEYLPANSPPESE